jgi:hypothetical protein
MPPLLTEYYDRREKPPTDPAKKILFAVMDDLLDRRGFDNAWDGCDRDIQEEILTTNLENIKRVMAS